ncbi:MAG: formate dehydrogenase accessory sulfurtransferase FdhD [Flavobacteriales bacterium]|nr:formate dehydrogenase accessory sulfurtransferase FdhD [Flavobacteriales bacterium]
MTAIQTVQAVKFENGDLVTVQDVLTREAPLQICVNDAPFTMTMRTPGNEEALVRGLLLSEQVVGVNCRSYRFQTTCIDVQGDTTSVNIQVEPSELLEGFNTERSLMSVSSCGICGKQDTADIIPQGRALEDDVRIDPKVLMQMFEDMATRQNTFIRSGGSHGAAAYDAQGKYLTIHEDIGRHNAVDKVIGQLLLDGELQHAAVLLVSGRVSFEIISKTFRAGIPVLAAVSAPSALAVEYAEQLGITLLAFCRENKCTAYSRTHRIFSPVNS